MTHVSSFEAVIKGGDDEAKLKAWRKKALLGSFTIRSSISKIMPAVGHYLRASNARLVTPRTLIANKHLYPVLKHLAFTYLAAPASTAANERLFNFAGNVVNEERPRTQTQLA
jgi:hypothetical protein